MGLLSFLQCFKLRTGNTQYTIGAAASEQTRQPQQESEKHVTQATKSTAEHNQVEQHTLPSPQAAAAPPLSTQLARCPASPVVNSCACDRGVTNCTRNPRPNLASRSQPCLSAADSNTSTEQQTPGSVSSPTSAASSPRHVLAPKLEASRQKWKLSSKRSSRFSVGSIWETSVVAGSILEDEDPQLRNSLNDEASASHAHEGTSIYASSLSERSADPSSLALTPRPSAGLMPFCSYTDSAVQLMSVQDIILDITGLWTLGSGAFSTVYKGYKHGVPLALKFVLSDTFSPESLTSREALLGAQIRHPSVVHTYATRVAYLSEDALRGVWPSGAADPKMLMRQIEASKGRQPGKEVEWNLPSILMQLGAKANQWLAVVVMELCDKGTLTKMIQRGKFKADMQRSHATAMRYLLLTAQDIAHGMQHLHDANIVHSDLKPANVLLSKCPTDPRRFIAKVSDFGLARMMAGSGPQHTTNWGTLHYMAPEHFECIISKAVDVYAFGIILWEMYTSNRPFDELLQGQVMLGVCHKGLRPTWPADAPAALVKLSERCWSHVATDRPTFEQCVEELRAMEQQFAAQLAVPDTPTSIASQQHAGQAAPLQNRGIRKSLSMGALSQSPSTLPIIDAAQQPVNQHAPVEAAAQITDVHAALDGVKLAFPDVRPPITDEQVPMQLASHEQSRPPTGMPSSLSQ